MSDSTARSSGRRPGRFVAGVDGCRTGWVVALRDLGTQSLSVRWVANFTDVLALPEAPTFVAVDMPIGLLDAAAPGGRECDRQGRALLGSPRCSSVFTPPVRAALCATTHPTAHAMNRASSPAGIGVTLQAFGILRKLREVDDAMTPALQDRVFEVHPELSFLAMAGRPARHGKKKAAGRSERLALLAAAGFSGVPARVTGAAPDDVLDAVAACWSAERLHLGTAARLPAEQPPRDARGLRMEIWG
jgi:predicted RNase H-like nuclease